MKWFFASGDAPFYFSDQLRQLSFLPQAWIDSYGFGQSAVPRLWIDYPFLLITHLLNRFGLSWFVIDKIWWFGVIALTISSSYRLGKLIFSSQKAGWLFALFYCLNTYTLMIFDGGQLGVLLGFGLLPLVLLHFYQYLTTPKIYRALLLALVLAGLLAADLRVFLLSLPLLIGILVTLKLNNQIRLKKHLFIIPIVVLALHAYWLLPLALYPAVSQSYQQVTGLTSAAFFSFADFSHSFSLLHPNWPENLFGKVYFYRPEFLLIPLIAFSVFLRKKIPWPASVGTLLVVIGAILAKGVNEPFSTLYPRLLSYIPGLSLFRDPTKWYIYIILGYALLLTGTLKGWKVRYLLPFLLVLTIWLYHPILTQTFRGNIRPIEISQEAESLQQLIQSQPPSRTLWLPTREQFSYQTKDHPSLIASDVFSESSVAGILRNIHSSDFQSTLRDLGIGLIIVPPDYRQKMFLDHYQYDERQRLSLIKGLESIELEPKKEFHEYAVFVTNTAVPVIRRMQDSIVFQQQFDPSWRLVSNGVEYEPQPTTNGFMEFSSVPQIEAFQLVYLPQSTANRGAVISGILLIIIVGSLVGYKRYDK